MTTASPNTASLSFLSIRSNWPCHHNACPEACRPSRQRRRSPKLWPMWPSQSVILLLRAFILNRGSRSQPEFGLCTALQKRSRNIFRNSHHFTRYGSLGSVRGVGPSGKAVVVHVLMMLYDTRRSSTTVHLVIARPGNSISSNVVSLAWPRSFEFSWKFRAR